METIYKIDKSEAALCEMGSLEPSFFPFSLIPPPSQIILIKFSCSTELCALHKVFCIVSKFLLNYIDSFRTGEQSVSKKFVNA